MDAKDVDVSVTGNRLMIKGEKKQEKEEKDDQHHYAERFYGTFQRTFTLPDTVKVDTVEATFDKGLLHINLPKAEETKRKKIDIKSK